MNHSKTCCTSSLCKFTTRGIHYIALLQCIVVPDNTTSDVLVSSCPSGVQPTFTQRSKLLLNYHYLTIRGQNDDNLSFGGHFAQKPSNIRPCREIPAKYKKSNNV